MDLRAVGLAAGTAQYGFVLGIKKHLAAVDGAVAGDNAIAGKSLLVHTEIMTLMFGQHVYLDEAANVEDVIDPLTCRQPAAVTQLLQTILAAALLRPRFYGFELFDRLLPVFIRNHVSV